MHMLIAAFYLFGSHFRSYGLLHRIPSVQMDSERQEEEYFDNAEVFVPADNDEYREHSPRNGTDDLDVRSHNSDRKTSPADSQGENSRSTRNNPPSTASTNSPHYLDPPIRTAISPVP